jgi:hypothetical protein
MENFEPLSLAQDVEAVRSWMSIFLSKRKGKLRLEC